MCWAATGQQGERDGAQRVVRGTLCRAPIFHASQHFTSAVCAMQDRAPCSRQSTSPLLCAECAGSLPCEGRRTGHQGAEVTRREGEGHRQQVAGGSQCTASHSSAQPTALAQQHLTTKSQTSLTPVHLFSHMSCLSHSLTWMKMSDGSSSAAESLMAASL